MNPYPYGPSSNQPMYPQPIPEAYPPQEGAYPPNVAYDQPQNLYPPQAGAYTTNVAYAQPPVSYAPQTVPPAIFGGMQFIYVQDPMSELVSCPSLLIRQEPDFLENFSGCEQPNIYHIFGNSPLGMRYLFKCIENSDFCSRKFCRSDQRPFNMNIIHCNSFDQLGLGYTTSFATMQKPCMCTVCCLCRPEIEVILKSTNQPVGKVKYIYTLCDPTFELYSISGGLKYIVTADCCQCALRCSGFLGKTSEGVFNILDAQNNQVVGRITKEPADISELVTDADSYVVNFPVNADANDKLILIGMALMIDYQFFETDASSEHNKRRKGGSSRSKSRSKSKSRGRRH